MFCNIGVSLSYIEHGMFDIFNKAKYFSQCK